MAYKYNPTAQELRDAYSVAYGDLGDTMLIGALYGHLKNRNTDSIETVYAKALEKVRKDMDKLVKA